MGDCPTFSDQDRQHMDLALDLARQGLGQVSPNPVVGCVITSPEGTVVGKGWHQGPGTPHAEIHAINDAGDQTSGATAYVTLEPCNHTGRTGPCSHALINAGIARVIYAMDDPNHEAAGGATHLHAAGIDVRKGLCAQAARDLNHAWVHYVTKKRPYIYGKSAMSLDGRIATAAGESKWITSDASRLQGHKLRASVDAIIVGANTVIADDPALTARLDETIASPRRIVLDSTARTRPEAQVYTDTGTPTLLVTTDAATQENLQQFADKNVDPLTLPATAAGYPDLDALMTYLYERGIVTVLVEGGGAVLGSFFDADLIDELTLFVAPIVIGGGQPAFGGKGIAQLRDADRFHFEAITIDGPDFFFRGTRQREAA